MKQQRSAFTLVELLVVIGIIAVLIGILLPTLSRARESANRIKCGSNLRSIGQAAYLFAVGHKGFFPRGFVTGSGNAMPSYFEYSEKSIAPVNTYMRPYADTPTEEAYEKTFGLTLSQWRRYGLGVKDLPNPPVTNWVPGDADRNLFGVLACPSSEGSNLANQLLHPAPGAWWPDKCIRTDYVYIGGYPAGPIKAGDPLVQPDGSYSERNTITVAPGFAGFFLNCANNKPACTTSDKNSSARILAMDRVFIDDPASKLIVTNHGVRYEGAGSNRFMPKFISILFGDGHVEGRIGTDHYKKLWLDITADPSMGHSSVDSWFYWGN